MHVVVGAESTEATARWPARWRRLAVPFVLFACGGTSVREVEDDAANGGSTGAGASGGSGSTDASGGSAGSVPINPFLCPYLEAALERAQACSADADCGKFVEAWPCGHPDAVPPLVNIHADLGEIQAELPRALEIGCDLVTSACTNCYVEQPECVNARCSWHFINCGPPPN